MTMRRFETTTLDPFLRGRELGSFGAADIARNVHIYQDLFAAVGVSPNEARAHGLAALARIEEFAPDLARELDGVSSASGIPLADVGMLNARTEVLATVGAVGEGECSTVAVLPSGAAPRSVQTWDWHDVSNERLLAGRHPTVDGLEVRYFSEFGMVGKIGLNSAGVGVHFNILNHVDDGAGIGVPVHVVARRVLDEARDLDEAIAIARSAAVSASTVLTIVTFDEDQGSRGACVELSAHGSAVVPPEDGWLVHTNHFLDDGLARGELIPADSSSYSRREHLRRRKDAFDTQDALARAQALVIHDDDGAPVCCHPDGELSFEHRWESLLTIALDLEASRLRFHVGTPCTATAQSWEEF